MIARHLALPRIWLLTDERQGEALWDAIDRLPRQAGVIVRHYSMSVAERQALARRIARRGRFVAFGGSEAAARKAQAAAIYGESRKRSRLPRLQPVHSRAEIVAAERHGAAMLLLSPVHPTRSHPDGRPLGTIRFGLLAHGARLPVIALGGMTRRRFQRVQKLGAAGWAAIDGWIRT